jgi:hypothetical protein
VRGLIALALLAAAAVFGGCASAAPPPGGPEDHTPPILIRITPDSNATNVRTKEINLLFSDVITDRPARGELGQYFLISPRDGATRVSWHRERVTIRPRNGFRPNTAYMITKLPGLADIRGNPDSTTIRWVFSTGPRIPTLGAVGRVFDWEAETPASNAVVEAISRPDSTVYVTKTDSSGGFTLGPFGPGRYTVIAYIDANSNFALDRGEKWDSTFQVIAGARPFLELLTMDRDTLPPRVQAVTATDSTTLQISFDRALAPGQALNLAQFSVVGSDSVALRIARLVTAAQLRASRDSTARVQEDSIRRADSVRAAATGRPPSGGRVTPPPLRPSQPGPARQLELRLAPATPLVGGRTYRVTARVIRGIAGRTATSTRLFTAPRIVRDTTPRLAPDTTRPRRPPLR